MPTTNSPGRVGDADRGKTTTVGDARNITRGRDSGEGEMALYLEALAPYCASVNGAGVAGGLVHYPDGMRCEPWPYGTNDGDGQADPYVGCECSTPLGGWHKPGCEAERCPRCAEQLISCGCCGWRRE